MNATTLTRLALLVAAGSTLASAAEAQLPNVSTRAFGMGGNYTAVGNGYDAVAWNPAMLGLRGNPGFSMALMAAGGSSGLDPIDLSAFAPYGGVTIPDDAKRAWLAKVTASGGENGRADAGVTPIALSIGPVAFQLSSSVYGNGHLTADAFEAVFFGNSGRDSTARALDFTGSDVRMRVFTTAALAYGMPIGDHLAIGVTGKYVVGNFMAMGRDDGSALSANGDVQLRFPIVYTGTDSLSSASVNNGAGYGLDLGAAWRGSRLTVGASLQNVVNTFQWDTTKFRAKAGSATFVNGSTTTNFDDQPYASAPQSLRDVVAADRFQPTLALGAAFKVNNRLLVSGDVRQRVSDKGLALGERTQIGAGAELRLIPFIPLRGGFTAFNDGWAASGGLGIHVGPVEVGAAAMMRTHNGGGRDAGAMIGVLSIH